MSLGPSVLAEVLRGIYGPVRELLGSRSSVLGKLVCSALHPVTQLICCRLSMLGQFLRRSTCFSDQTAQHASCATRLTDSLLSHKPASTVLCYLACPSQAWKKLKQSGNLTGTPQ